MRKSIMPDFEATLRSIYSGSGKGNAASFAGWVQRTQATRKALLENKRQHREELEQMKDIYAQRVLDEKKAAYEIDEMELASIARDRVTEDLETVIAAKTAQYNRAMGAPSEEQLRLVSVMRMRQETGEDLTSTDFAGAVGNCADNFHCLKMLQNLANRAGVAFPMIHDDFREDLDTVRRSATNILTSIDKPQENLGYLENLFWSYGSAGLNQNVFDKLDSLAYLTTTPDAVEKAKVERSIAAAEQSAKKTGTVQNSKFCSKVKLKGLESIDAIADQFHVTRSDIATINPGVDLDGLHAGLEIYIPSTRFSFDPGNPSRVQSSQVQVAETPTFSDPKGPNGETVGEDIVL